jgi:micrococcal nuclease
VPPSYGSYYPGETKPLRSGSWFRSWQFVAVLIAVAALLLGVAGVLAFTSTGTSSNATSRTSPKTTSGGSSQAPAGPPAAVVSRVVNGDALWLDRGKEKIRLVQIDAPDIAANQCYAQQSLDALKRIAAPGVTVELEKDRKLSAQDQFGRELRYVYVGGKNVNLLLVSEGAAAPYFFFGQRGRYARQLLRDAQQAKRAGSGFWGACPGTKLDPNHEVHTRP